jgi:hypothetical protein
VAQLVSRRAGSELGLVHESGHRASQCVRRDLGVANAIKDGPQIALGVAGIAQPTVTEGKTTPHRLSCSSCSRRRNRPTAQVGSSITRQPATDFGFSLSTTPFPVTRTRVAWTTTVARSRSTAFQPTRQRLPYAQTGGSHEVHEVREVLVDRPLILGELGS